MNYILANVWINSIAILILAIALFFLVGLLGKSNRMKIILSVLSVLLIFSLGGVSAFTWYKLEKKKEAYKLVKPHIAEVKDLSDFEASKYLVNIVVPAHLNKEQTKEVLSKSNDFIKRNKKGASIIWLAVFNKKLPKEELNATKDNPYFVCQSQWVSSSYNGFISADFEAQENYKDLEVFWNK